MPRHHYHPLGDITPLTQGCLGDWSLGELGGRVGLPTLLPRGSSGMAEESLGKAELSYLLCSSFRLSPS